MDPPAMKDTAVDSLPDPVRVEGMKLLRELGL
jgi:hypothetical protein